MTAFLKHYTQPAFVICVLLLAGAAVGMPTAMKYLDVYLTKEPLPISKSLDLLDAQGLSHYQVVAKSAIDNREVLKSLGTEDYIQWVLQDNERQPDSKTRFCHLFITYYDLPDRVPHVPEECYAGGGYERISSDAISFDVPKDGAVVSVPGKCVMFSGKEKGSLGADTVFPVTYLLRVNGRYAADRNSARALLGSSFRKHSYFSKVEMLFFGMEFGSKIYPDKEQIEEAGQKLLSVILPILEREHWPTESKSMPQQVHDK
jgi:hypothetical protein